MLPEEKQDQAQNANADNTAQNPAPTDTPQGQAPQGQDQQDIEEKIKALEDRYKAEIAGLNRKISEREKETEKALKAKDREKLDEAERIKAEMEDAKEEKQRIENEAKELKRQISIDRALMSAGMPAEFAKRIHGETPEEIEADVKALKKYLDDQMKASIEDEIKNRLGGKPPAGGEQNNSGKTASVAEFYAMSPKDRAKFVSNGGVVSSE